MNKGFKICLRLRYPTDKNQFVPIEQVVDTMLHELCHIVHGPHNQQFHALWDQLRDEHQGLLMKGYTGEGFLSEGRRLGGQQPRIPPREARRLALQAAEKRKNQPTGTGPGQRLGGLTPRPGDDVRRVIADAVERRNNTLKGCGTEKLNDDQIRDISEAATKNGFRTQAEEDEANEIAIAQALMDLVQEDEMLKQQGSSHVPRTQTPSPPPTVQETVTSPASLFGRTYNAPPREPPKRSPALPTTSRNAQDGQSTMWVCLICTLHNPQQFLCCEACGTERGGPGAAERSNSRPIIRNVGPEDRSRSTTMGRDVRSESSRLIKKNNPKGGKKQAVDLPHFTKEVVDLTSSPPPIPPRKASAKASRSESSSQPDVWLCSFCSTVMERKWWACKNCGTVKSSST